MDLQVQTPLKRLMTGLTLSNFAANLALFTPIVVLLTLKLTFLDPDHVATNLSYVTGIGAFFALIFNPIAGFISDRTTFKLGRRRTWILFGLVFGGLSLVGIGLSNQVWQIVLFWCCAQGFYNFTLSANMALVAEQVDDSKKGSISGMMGMTQNLTILLGMLLMTAMSKQSNLSKFSVLAIFGVVAAVVALMLIREGKYMVKKKSSSSVKTKFSIWSVFPDPRKHRPFMWAWISRFLVMMGIASTNYNSVLLTQRFGIKAEDLSGKMLILTFVSTICIVVSSIVCGKLSDKLKIQKPFVLGSGLLMAVALIVIAFSYHFNVLIFANALYGIGAGVYWAVDIALVTRVLPSKDTAAKDLGIINIANALPQSIVPAIAPILLSIGGYSFMFTFLGIVGIFGGLTILPVPELGQDNKAKISEVSDLGLSVD
ncbi:MFS transporter [Paenibacillus sp. CAA11]|uniref:MFS transporter n=1 Tax=Paenibacillus sp. CAA11 TaxID=1532905 RepID=UPI000D33D05F|nr:MFS transporter [Paenibacillus sp. CAA11]AWB46609.1 MFS transporter [Paenibacillus sp. CAA11]